MTASCRRARVHARPISRLIDAFDLLAHCRWMSVVYTAGCPPSEIGPSLLLLPVLSWNSRAHAQHYVRTCSASKITSARVRGLTNKQTRVRSLPSRGITDTLANLPSPFNAHVPKNFRGRTWRLKGFAPKPSTRGPDPRWPSTCMLLLNDAYLETALVEKYSGVATLPSVMLAAETFKKLEILCTMNIIQ